MQTNDFYLKFDINANLLISSKKSVHSHLPILGIVVSLSLSGFDTLITTKTKRQDGPFKKDPIKRFDYDKVIITLASPDSVLKRSEGEIKKPETINYRTYKLEMEGLFCERVFGPTKDYECYCGKYKRIRYKGIVCDRCGVQVTGKKVRRERMGHVKLVVPVVHIWDFKSLPNKIGYLLGCSSKKLESIVYYERYAVIQPGKAAEGVLMQTDKGEETRNIEYLELLTEEEYLSILDSEELKTNHLLPDEDPAKLIAKMGAKAVKDLPAPAAQRCEDPSQPRQCPGRLGAADGSGPGIETVPAP